MKILRKMDEMERNIVSKSEKIALLFSQCCLVAWCIDILVTDGAQKLTASWPFLLVLSTALVQFWSSQIMRRRMNKGNKDEK